MPSYPSLNIGLDSSQELESGIEDDFSQPGVQHSRLFHAQQYYRFRLVHTITMTQFNSLLATYAADKRSDFTLTYYNTSPVSTYTVRFLSPPSIRVNHGANNVEVESNLRGYKN